MKIFDKVKIKENITELKEEYKIYINRETYIVSTLDGISGKTYRVFNIFLPKKYLERINNDKK